jgi:hypothetical protein
MGDFRRCGALKEGCGAGPWALPLLMLVPLLPVAALFLDVLAEDEANVGST